MDCPYCNFHFKTLAINAPYLPSPAPIVCERCANVGLVEDGMARQITDRELAALKQSPAWAEMIGPAIKIIEEQTRNKLKGMN
jgi:hypothetical protein